MRRMYACLGVIGLTILTICVVMLVRTNPKDLVYELPGAKSDGLTILELSLIHISEPTRLLRITYAVLCLKKKNTLQFLPD